MTFRTWFKSAHTLYLEEEVIRLRGEVRRLIDAALESKGLAPLSKPEPREMPPVKQRLLPSQFIRKYEAMSAKAGESDAKN